ncbi:MAG: hypothetical protein R3E94_03775 [Burkholderiaceae bacterium]
MPPVLRSLLFPALVLALCYIGWRTYGWQGLLLAALMSSFWALLHINKLIRLMRAAASRPLGELEDVRALQQRLKPGMPMHEVVRQAGCLGKRQDAGDGDSPRHEDFVWHDAQGRTLHLRFDHGRLRRIERRDAPASGETPGQP